MTDEDDFSDIDLLMSVGADDPQLWTKADLDRIIAYERKQRRLREAGVKTRKPKDEAPSKLDVSALLNKIQPASSATFKRRV